MSFLFSLAMKSLKNRKGSVLLTLMALSISVVLLLGVNQLKESARSIFLQTISGTDLIVGARSGPINLLLYSVFHIGTPTNNVSWKSYQKIKEHKNVKWVIPISLGDSHKGYRVVGTENIFFEQFRYGEKNNLAFSTGKAFTEIMHAVVGSEVAHKLKYQVGKEIILTHGLVSASFAEHKNHPFKVVGILAPTGTPVDQSVYVSLAGIDAIHSGWQSGTYLSGQAGSQSKKEPQAITAAYVGLESKVTTFAVQRWVNNYRQEPLLAILPGVTLAELWRFMSTFEKLLLVIAGFVVVAGVLGLIASLLMSLRERRREVAILRSVGAGPKQILILFWLDSFIITITSCLLGVLLYYVILIGLKPILSQNLGISMPINPILNSSYILLASVLLTSLIAGLIPAVVGYRNTLHDGLSIRA